jgi:hypothetical protein
MNELCAEPINLHAAHTLEAILNSYIYIYLPNNLFCPACIELLEPSSKVVVSSPIAAGMQFQESQSLLGVQRAAAAGCTRRAPTLPRRILSAAHHNNEGQCTLFYKSNTKGPEAAFLVKLLHHFENFKRAGVCLPPLL